MCLFHFQQCTVQPLDDLAGTCTHTKMLIFCRGRRSESFISIFSLSSASSPSTVPPRCVLSPFFIYLFFISKRITTAVLLICLTGNCFFFVTVQKKHCIEFDLVKNILKEKGKQMICTLLFLDAAYISRISFLSLLMSLLLGILLRNIPPNC